MALLTVGPGLAHAEQVPICTDRPTKANAVCTVPAASVQVESSLAGWSLANADGLRTESFSLGASVVKLGLSGRSDLQVGFTPYARVTAAQSGVGDRVSGFGDVVVRYKRRLTNEHAKLQVAAIPFVKLPTAKRGLGNREIEGGLVVPVGFPLAGPATVTLGPELDLLADADGNGRHLSLVNLVNVAGPVAHRLTIVGELWSNLNFDPDGKVRQASADGAIAYSLTNDVQIDAGANLGLTRDTPDVEVYAGISTRY